MLSFPVKRILGLLLVLCVLRPTWSYAQEGAFLAPIPEIRESVALDTDGAVVKQFGTARDYIADERWDDAIDLLSRIAESRGKTLVKTSAGHYVSTARYADMMIAGLPSGGLAAYRRRVDSLARKWFESGKRHHDETMLRQVVNRSFNSSYGDDAIWLLGEWAWQQGETAAARSYWTQLVPIASDSQRSMSVAALRYPDTSYLLGDVLARLVLCSLAEGDRERSDRERETFRRLFPNVEGELAARRGRLADILDAVSSESKHWSFPAAKTALATFAVDARRAGSMPRSVDVGAALWSVDLPITEFPSTRSKPALPEIGPLSYYPVVSAGIVLVNDSERIYAWDASTGKPAWPVDDDASAIIYPPVSERVPRDLPSTAVGVPHFTMSVHEGRLFAKMGTPITSPSDATRLLALPSDLVCLDLEHGQGKLVWKTSAHELDAGTPDKASSVFEGTPIVHDDRLFVALSSRQPQTQTSVACLDAGNGKLIWIQKVCAALSGPTHHQDVVAHQLLTLAHGVIYFSTNQGAIAALDAFDGTMKWVVTYETRSVDDPSATNDQTRHTLKPCLYYRGTIAAAPNDTDDVFGIDAATGTVLWRHRLRGGTWHLLGARQGTLVASGARLWGIEIDTGTVNWQIGSADPATFGYGRGLLAGNEVLWPKRDEIFTVHQRTGELLRRIPLTRLHGESGGNLTIAKGILLIAQPTRLVGFGQIDGTESEPGDKSAASHSQTDAAGKPVLVRPRSSNVRSPAD